MKTGNLLILIISCGFIFFGACKKDDAEASGNFTYTLGGRYERDTANHADGYKLLDLKDDDSYCWVRVISGQDSTFCFGKYRQTSDTSLLWEESTLVTFKVTPIDSVPKRIQLQLTSGPATPPLYGYVK